MPCDSVRRKNQSLQDRKKEVKDTVSKIEKAIVAKKATVKVGKQGAIAFSLPLEIDRFGITDACIYRRIMAGNSVLAKAAIAQAEQIAGRTVDKVAIGQGIHSHDGGNTWHSKG